MSGLGAWNATELGPTRRYHYNMDVPDDRVRHGIFAFKQELIYIGKGQGIILDLPQYGNAIRDRVAEFQAHTGLLGDWGVHEGEIDAKTARYIFWTRANRVALQSGIPGRLVSRLKTLESADDPVAQGYVDPADEGHGQIHLPFHPEITIEQAHDPSFALPWIAGQLTGAASYCDGDYDGAVAAYNIGWTYAREWVRAGKPASLIINDFDWGARATHYVALVKSQPIF